MLEYVFYNNNGVRKKIERYNEVKIPLLTTAILKDKGGENLLLKMEELKKSYQKNTETKEEKVISLANQSIQNYMKAKTLIVREIRKIKNNEEQEENQ